MSAPMKHVIVGAGLAGAKAAETIRQGSADASIVLIGDETVPPYERPPLSKAHLRSADDDRTAMRVHADDFYERAEIDLRTGVRVVDIDTEARAVSTAEGERIPYDRLLLAPGSAPNALPIDGADGARVHRLRTLSDSDALRAAMQAGGEIVVVGAGWIGCEVAASARQIGLDVHLVDPGPTPLHGALGSELGGFYREVQQSHGVRTYFGTRPTSIVEGRDGVRVVLDDGTSLDASLVAIGVGATPRTELAQRADLDVSDGVQVHANLETSVRGVFAAGDVASAWHPFFERHVRVEHWANALHQGVCAGQNMLDGVEIYDRLPYFFSDQYDIGMEFVGLRGAEDELVLRGEFGAEEFLAFWTRDGRVTAALQVNTWDVVEELERLIRSRAGVDPAVLADPAVPLETITRVG